MSLFKNTSKAAIILLSIFVTQVFANVTVSIEPTSGPNSYTLEPYTQECVKFDSRSKSSIHISPDEDATCKWIAPRTATLNIKHAGVKGWVGYINVSLGTERQPEIKISKVWLLPEYTLEGENVDNGNILIRVSEVPKK